MKKRVKYDIEYISWKEFDKDFDAVNFKQFLDIQEFLFQFSQFDDSLLKRDVIEKCVDKLVKAVRLFEDWFYFGKYGKQF